MKSDRFTFRLERLLSLRQKAEEAAAIALAEARNAETAAHEAKAALAKYPDITVVGSIAGGLPAAKSILSAAEEGDVRLICVGSRGHGGFKGLMLGSVSQQIVHHAPCPVVIVPPSKPGKPWPMACWMPAFWPASSGIGQVGMTMNVRKPG